MIFYDLTTLYNRNSCILLQLNNTCLFYRSDVIFYAVKFFITENQLLG